MSPAGDDFSEARECAVDFRHAPSFTVPANTRGAGHRVDVSEGMAGPNTNMSERAREVVRGLPAVLASLTTAGANFRGFADEIRNAPVPMQAAGDVRSLRRSARFGSGRGPPSGLFRLWRSPPGGRPVPESPSQLA